MPGKTYFLTIPIQNVPLGHSSSTDNQQRPIALVVDDDKAVADTLSFILTHFGFVVITAYSSATALETASRIQPELLISEVMLPGSNGVDLAVQIRSNAPACEVILLSGRASLIDFFSMSPDTQEFVFLNKPLHPTALLSRIPESLKARAKQIPLRRMEVATA